MKIKIDDKYVGDNYPCYTIAEIGSNFDGDLSRAKKLIDLAKKAGADAVKFQCFKTDKIISKKGFDKLKMGFQAKWDKPVYEVYEDAVFPRDWNKALFDYAKSKNITYFSTPYDEEAVDQLDELGVSVFKIGSGDVNWLDLVKYIAKKGKPILLGTGASNIKEVEEAIETIKSTGNENIIVLQCVTNYPASFKNANIKTISMFRDKFNLLTGYSDHTPGYIVPLGTVALGGCIIEKHFTDNKSRKGPDHPFAMDYNDFKKMVDNIRKLEKSMGSPNKEVYDEEEETRILQRRCLRASIDIKKDTVISKEMISILRPAPKESLEPKKIDLIISKTSSKDIKKGDLIKLTDMRN